MARRGFVKDSVVDPAAWDASPALQPLSPSLEERNHSDRLIFAFAAIHRTLSVCSQLRDGMFYIHESKGREGLFMRPEIAVFGGWTAEAGDEF